MPVLMDKAFLLEIYISISVTTNLTTDHSAICNEINHLRCNGFIKWQTLLKILSPFVNDYQIYALHYHISFAAGIKLVIII